MPAPKPNFRAALAAVRRIMAEQLADPDLFEDAFVDAGTDDDLGGDEFACLEDNDCSNDGGHLIAFERCIYCGKRFEP